MQPYSFLTQWQFAAPIEAVWQCLNEPQHFCQWWPGFERSEVLAGKGEPGSTIRCRVRSRLGLAFDFDLEVIERLPPLRLALASRGDFRGQGIWQLQQSNGSTHVTYTWEVALAARWLRWLGRWSWMRRQLERSHDRVMEDGRRALAEWLQR